MEEIIGGEVIINGLGTPFDRYDLVNVSNRTDGLSPCNNNIVPQGCLVGNFGHSIGFPRYVIVGPNRVHSIIHHQHIPTRMTRLVREKIGPPTGAGMCRSSSHVMHVLVMVFQEVTTDGFEWTTDSGNFVGERLIFGFAGYFEDVTEMQLLFPVGETYIFDLSIFNRLDSISDAVATVEVRRGLVFLTSGLCSLPLHEESCRRYRLVVFPS